MGPCAVAAPWPPRLSTAPHPRTCVALAAVRATWHMADMTEAVPHPYSITVEPLKKPEGQFGWALRKHGKLIERSDRPFSTEAKAFEAAMKAIERSETGFGSR